MGPFTVKLGESDVEDVHVSTIGLSSGGLAYHVDAHLTPSEFLSLATELMRREALLFEGREPTAAEHAAACRAAVEIVDTSKHGGE